MFSLIIAKVLSFNLFKMKITTISIKGFDNIEKECIGYVTMLVKVGGKFVHKVFLCFSSEIPI